MSRGSKFALAMIAGAAVAVPTTLVLAGGNTLSGDANVQSVAFNGKATAPKNWKPVPGLIVASGDGGTLVSTALSAQMTRGKAKFRIVPISGGPAVPPGPVLFSAKAANSFTWGRIATCPGPYRLEWKRAGRGKAIAANLSSHSVLDEFCF